MGVAGWRLSAAMGSSLALRFFKPNFGVLQVRVCPTRVLALHA